MEKLVYVFWRRAGQEPQQLRRTLLSEVRAGLDSLGVARLQVNIADLAEREAGLPRMQDPHLYFDAVGDDAKLQGNLARMMESVHRFLEPDGTDLIRTSEYLLHAATEPSL